MFDTLKLTICACFRTAQLAHEVFERLKKDKALWRTMPGVELFIGPVEGWVPFCDEDLTPLKAAWSALRPLFGVCDRAIEEAAESLEIYEEY